MVDGALGQLAPVGGAPISLERIFGIAFAPLAWCLGVPSNEAQTAGSLLGAKLMLTGNSPPSSATWPTWPPARSPSAPGSS